jgi:hypothetical protein
MKPVRDKWVARDGSVFCETKYQVKSDFGVKYVVQDSIAFNVGQEIAEHIVRLHNAELENKND